MIFYEQHLLERDINIQKNPTKYADVSRQYATSGRDRGRKRTSEEVSDECSSTLKLGREDEVSVVSVVSQETVVSAEVVKQKPAKKHKKVKTSHTSTAVNNDLSVSNRYSFEYHKLRTYND